MDDLDDTVAFDSPEAIMEMRKRHLQLAMIVQQIVAVGLAELRVKAARGELSAEECEQLRVVELELQKRTARSGKPH
jgi:hypothetical protein